MDKQTFQRSMAYLAAAYSREITTEQAAVYWDQLGSLDADAFLEAVRAQVGHSSRFPTVAELRVHYREALRRRADASAPRLTAGTPADRRKVRSLLRSLREQLRP